MGFREQIFVDSDVALDHLADRQPFSEYAHRLFALAETGDLTLCLSALAFSNLYYILRKLKGHDEALSLLAKLLQLAKVTSVGEPEIEAAFASKFRDFEDAIQHASAKEAGGINAIIKRNKADVIASEILVCSADLYLATRQKPTQ